MAATHFFLTSRYPDLDRDLIGDLVTASVHAMWVPFSIPSQDVTVAYVDRVVGLLRAATARAEAASPGDGAGSVRAGSHDVDFRSLTMRDLHLGKGPWSDAAVARMERWLAERRPDLDRELLRELCLAAYLRHRRERLTPTQASILAWLQQTVPPTRATVRRPQRAPLRRVGRPKGSGRTIRSAEVFRAAYDKVGAGRAGQPTQAEVAASLGVSVSTLQTYLKEWGISWADLP
jgi:hypothetical protein